MLDLRKLSSDLYDVIVEHQFCFYYQTQKGLLGKFGSLTTRHPLVLIKKLKGNRVESTTTRRTPSDTIISTRFSVTRSKSGDDTESFGVRSSHSVELRPSLVSRPSKSLRSRSVFLINRSRPSNLTPGNPSPQPVPVLVFW